MAEHNKQDEQNTTKKDAKKASKKVAKKKTVEAGESYFDNYSDLYAEFRTGKMPTQKLNALLLKLTTLYKSEEITEADQEMMEEILRKGRIRGTLSSKNTYLLNKIESDSMEDIAVVKIDNAPVVHHLKKDLLCKYFYDEEYNDHKNKPDSIGRFYVYVPRTIAPRNQLDYAAASKLAEKIPLDPSEIPDPKVVIHRIILKKTEFERWFEITDPDILNRGTVDPTDDTGTYTF
jgi:hypothetical protein